MAKWVDKTNSTPTGYGNTTTDMLFKTLRENIMNYTLKPGQRLIEREIAQEMATSRTPVREAIRKLEKEGLVIVVPNRGAYVAPFSVADMTEIYQIRMVIEALAGRIATPHVTEETLKNLRRINTEMRTAAERGDFKLARIKNTEFHNEIYKKCDNRRLYEMITQIWDYAQRLRTTILSASGRLQDVLAEHEEIMDALRCKEPEEVEKLIKQHLVRAQEAFHKAVAQDMIMM